MTRCIKFGIFLCSLVFVFSKDLHAKPNWATNDHYDKGFLNLFEDEYTNKNGRFARHLKTVTESVLDHLFHEIKQEYHNVNYNANSPIQRLIRNLNKELKRHERTKLLKEIEKRKNLNKKKNKIGKKKQRLGTTKFA